MKWTFKLYEPGHASALDLVLAPAIGYGWYRLGVWAAWSPWYWFGLAFFSWAVATAFAAGRRQGKLRFPWEPRPGSTAT